MNTDDTFKPSDFTNFPWNSVLQKTESEIVATNIMKILSRTGNYFRELSWEKYKEERLKDKNFSEVEKSHFNKVIKYCGSPSLARTFSPSWNKF